MQIINPTKPCEVISLFPADLSPNDDGSIMFYVVLDSFSEFLFQLEVANANTELNLLNSIKQLMKNKNFNLYNHPFTLVLHKYEHLRNEIESIIKPYGGTFVVDDLYVNKGITRFGNAFQTHKQKIREGDTELNTNEKCPITKSITPILKPVFL